MALLSVDDLCLQFGQKILFEGASLAIEAGDRVGIVGANGMGKSTLLRILAGQQNPDGGQVSRAKDCRVGYLAQEHGEPGPDTLLASVLKMSPARASLDEAIQNTEQALSRTTDTASQLQLSEKLAELHTRLQDLEQDFGLHEAQRILAGLGFQEHETAQPVQALSGGWRMRAALAGLLFQKPHILLLDEPTNHLDWPSVRWLSRFLSASKSALVLTCHDRSFLNTHSARIVGLEAEGLRVFRGNYDQYKKQRSLELLDLKKQAARQAQRKKELEAFITRFRAKASKARQAQSKAKLIEKLEARLVEIPTARSCISIRFAPVKRSGELALSIQGLAHAYDEKQIFEGLDLEVRRQDRIAVVGMNGQGKTTLLKLLAGELKAQGGQIVHGAHVCPRYFAQHHTEILDPSRTVLEEVYRAAPELSQTEARSLCGSFLFSGDDIEKPISVLSGGEKARVALARILAAPGNVLLLDEPTNHLDTESAHELTTSLESYDGTMIFVSHNLDFAERLSNKVWDVHEGKVTEYPGSLKEYLTHLEAQPGSTPLAGEPSQDKATTRVPLQKEARMQARAREKEQKRKRDALKKSIQKLEQDIDRLEEEKTELEGALADPSSHLDRDHSQKLSEQYQAKKRMIENKMAEWEELQEKLES